MVHGISTGEDTGPTRLVSKFKSKGKGGGATHLVSTCIGEGGDELAIRQSDLGDLHLSMNSHGHILTELLSCI